MSKRKYKVISIILSFIIILMYALDIIYSNKVHNLHILANPIYNNELLKYDSISILFSRLFIIGIHVLAIAIYCLNEKSKVKGLLYLNIAAVAVFSLCFGLDIILDNFYFTVSSKIVEFTVLLLSISIFYLILFVFGVLRNRKPLMK